MPSYIYTAKDKLGKDITGHLQANTEQELAAHLRTKGLVLISVEKAGQAPKAKFSLKNLSWGSVSRVEKMLFARHLAVMIEAGLSLNQALVVLAEQARNKKFKKIIAQINESVRQGQAFSDSLAKYPKTFNSLFVNMVKVGETSGNLNEVLKLLAEQMKKDHELISRIRGAMMYPAVIVVAMVGIGILMMIMVVPKLTDIFEELQIDLPFTTKIVIGISKFLENNLILGIIFLLALIIGTRFALRVTKVKNIISTLLISMPLFGPLIRKINSARFARTLSSLISGGVAIVKAMQIVAGTLGNYQFKRALLNSANEVQKGTELSKALNEYRQIYTPMVIQMIEVGEQTGELADILLNLAEFYEEEIDNTTKSLSSIIEPILMIIIGAAVGFFAVSMLQPMYSMMSGI